ncbi:MAG: hypothetical protein JXR70_08570 [Spirochaetales bacterium]|nr:hypothetical protein [Spirochaetales bacterium]
MLLSEVIIESETDQNITISKDSWKKIQDEVLKTEKNLTKADFKNYVGKIKLSIDPLKYQKSIRNDW